MDVWVNFTHATKWQAEGIFKCFFPFKPTSPASSTSSLSSLDASQQNLPGIKRKSVHAIPLLTEEEIGELAKRFSEAIPEDELSVSMSGCRVYTGFANLFLAGCEPSRLSSEEQDSSA